MQTIEVSPIEFATWIVVLGSATIALWRGARAIYRSTFGSRRDLRSRLDRMACGTTREYAEELFGRPALRSGLSDLDHEEVTYVTRHGFVVVLEQRADRSTAAWSFTSTDRRFVWDLYYVSLGQLKVSLGRDSFSAADRTGAADALDDGVDSNATYRVLYGAHSGQYAEAHYRGNPGGYQTYVLVWNDAGASDRPDLEAIQEAWIPQPPRMETGFMAPADIDPDTLELLARVRRSSAPNTLTVLGAHMEVETWQGMAIHHHTIRVLPIADTRLRLRAYRWSNEPGLRARIIRRWVRLRL